MKFNGNTPSNPYESVGPQSFPTLPNAPLGPGYSPGTIRDTLGAGLKASGFFQKNGQINNSRGGFIGPKQAPFPGPLPGNSWQAPPANQTMNAFPQQNGGNPGYQNPPNQGYGNFQPGMNQSRQLVLQAAQEGIMGNGVATISPDNSFLLIANLPPPQAFLSPGQAGQYAAYLVDDRGRTGFLAGVLRPVGNGVYRTHFQSQVPLYPYSRAVVSVESLNQLGQAPNGPIILKVKEPMGVMTFLNPMKNTASTVWGKISGLISGRKKPPISPDSAPLSPEMLSPLNQTGVSPETLVPPPPQ
ncbi:hypothetical protein REC12_09965 [Desulfosporosinus sp. PR]|uniref:hypothetical protein n=1 Tax=Candidatus Desulfosporosinus nitrosoreducens TaxID=3401928 RepID=UPI0027F7C43A|nr:hypothetical protein [Desulfosporosinus sp. PR]MDQ7093915.1 hypothetical protein [Desulfosporosinus sp. PR]